MRRRRGRKGGGRHGRCGGGRPPTPPRDVAGGAGDAVGDAAGTAADTAGDVVDKAKDALGGDDKPAAGA